MQNKVCMHTNIKHFRGVCPFNIAIVKKKKVDGDVDCFYIVLFSALEHTDCALKYIRLEQAGVVDHSA